jgi:Ca2+-binding RTX toxin-like protein
MAIRRGTNGDDILTGTTGDDIFIASAGADHMIGGNGADTVDYSAIVEQPRTWYGVNGVYVDLSEGFGGAVGGERNTYSGIENITGSNFDDALLGDNTANVFRGLDGNDIMEGLGGGDRLEGGAGVDSLSYQQSTARVVVDLLNNTASGGHATGDSISGFENLTGSRYSDVLSGGNDDNRINGGRGADSINGRGGNDTINGGEGNDVLTGGSGFDTFVFSGLAGSDRITDFDVDRDTLRIDAQGNASVNVSYGNYNPYALTYDLIVEMGDQYGEFGTVVLEDIFIGDLNQVMGQIEIV